MKALITGAQGQLGSAFVRLFRKQDIPFAAPLRHQLDITNEQQVRSVVQETVPDVIINCAAYNQVDQAESEPERAFAANAIAPAALAAAAAGVGARLVHYSTDYVFDGLSQRPYDEGDACHPLNVYGASKREGETAVLNANVECLLLRVSWVFGQGGHSFFHKLLQWSQTGKDLRIVDDQVSVPTYTEDIVHFTMLALEQRLTGCWHLSASGSASRYESACTFMEAIGKISQVQPVHADAFESAAERPAYSVMSNQRLMQALQQEIPDWKSGVQRFAEQYLKSG